MKLVQLLAIAGFAATGLAGATAAQAQDWRYRDRHEQRYDRYDRHDRWDRHHRWGHNRRPGWDRGYGYRGRPNCWEEWRYGRPVRVCRR